MKTIIRVLKRNHRLYNLNKIYERLNLCLIRDNDNAFQRNKRAVEYIDEKTKGKLETDYETLNEYIREIRKILTCFETDNVLDEVNSKDEFDKNDLSNMFNNCSKLTFNKNPKEIAPIERKPKNIDNVYLKKKLNEIINELNKKVDKE